jgi:WhiB family redox-sensing transcriptional regulator
MAAPGRGPQPGSAALLFSEPDCPLEAKGRTPVSVLLMADELTLPCHTDDPELWFAEEPAHIDRARALCARCPLIRECLAEAIERREPWGVWGGELFERGEVVAQRRPKGRPRKDAAHHELAAKRELAARLAASGLVA